MSRVLVTGGCGFIGSNLVKRLQLGGHDVTVLDNYISGKTCNHHAGVKYITGSTTNIRQILKNEDRFNACFHMAEYSRIATSFEDIELVWDSNCVGTFEVLQYCRETSTKIIYGASSTKFAPEGISHSPYSFTKAKSSELIKSYSTWFGLDYAICFFYCVFGHGYDTSPVPGYQSVINIFEEQYRSNKPLTVTGDGSQKRSFTYVEDVISGLISAWRCPQSDSFQLYAEKEYSIIEIASMFTDDVVFIPSRPGDRTSGLNSIDTKSRDLLGWRTSKDVSSWIEEIKKSKERQG